MCVLDEAECSRKAASGRRVSSANRSLKGLQLECARILRETLLVPVLMYGSETMIWKEEERSRIGAVEMDKIRSLLVIRRMGRVPNTHVTWRGLMKLFSDGSAILRE